MSTLSLSPSLYADAGLNGRPKIRGLDFSRAESQSLCRAIERGFPNADAIEARSEMHRTTSLPPSLPPSRTRVRQEDSLDRQTDLRNGTHSSFLDWTVNGRPPRERERERERAATFFAPSIQN